MRVYGLGTEGIRSGVLDGTTTTLQAIFLIIDVIHVSLELETTQGAGLTATWQIEADNHWSPAAAGGGGPWFGQGIDAGSWVDVTADFTPAVTSPVAGTTKQMLVMSPCPFRALRVTATRTGGNGSGKISVTGKGL